MPRDDIDLDSSASREDTFIRQASPIWGNTVLKFPLQLAIFTEHRENRNINPPNSKPPLNSRVFQRYLDIMVTKKEPLMSRASPAWSRLYCNHQELCKNREKISRYNVDLLAIDLWNRACQIWAKWLEWDLKIGFQAEKRSFRTKKLSGYCNAINQQLTQLL